MPTRAVHSQPEPTHIRGARLALDRVLAADPDLYTGLAIGAALAVLADVHPPYPPPPDQADPIDTAEGVAIALGELSRAVEAAATAEEAIRVGLAARELRDLRP